jgi:basic amino acid/polyamine antiporter, APA family
MPMWRVTAATCGNLGMTWRLSPVSRSAPSNMSIAVARWRCAWCLLRPVAASATRMTGDAQGLTPPGELRRSLGFVDAVVIGLGAMLGAGIFTALAPAARAAGSGLLVGLAVAAFIAYCNGTSSAKLAALYPQSGGTYVYGRKRLGDFWGFYAGWGFVTGKVASCAAMALTVGAYAWPSHAHQVAVGAVVSMTAVNYFGIKKSVWLTRVIIVVVLTVLAAIVASVAASGAASPLRVVMAPTASFAGVVQAAGFLFFAFAGYARIATLGEEVRDPVRTIPRAIPVALTLTLIVYATVAVSALAALGPERLADSVSPLTDAVRVSGDGWLVPVVAVGAAVAALGSLLALILGVSRTSLAMARDRHLPHALAAVHPRYKVPHRTELTVGIAVAILAAFTDIRGAIGFSSFAVLTYYAVANASALTLRDDEGGPLRIVPIAGLLGCVLLAVFMPVRSVEAGVIVSLVGVLYYVTRKMLLGARESSDHRSYGVADGIRDAESKTTTDNVPGDGPSLRSSTEARRDRPSD